MDIKEVKTLYEGKIFNVLKMTYINSENETIIRDIVRKSPCVVGLVFNTDLQKFIITKEFRVGQGRESFGFVAGMIDEYEDPFDAMVRELDEETGYQADYVYPLGYAHTSSGFTDEKIYYYFIEVAGSPLEQQLDSDENISIHYVTGKELKQMLIGNGLGNHAHACYLKAMLHSQI